MASATPSDMYMNFLDATVTMGATSTDVVSTEVATGLSIRGGLAFLIHKVEWCFNNIGAAATSYLEAALSTRSGETSVPELGDQGTIDRYFLDCNGGTSSSFYQSLPIHHNFLPPIPVAAPKIVCYATASVDTAVFRSKTLECRIGFTTVKIDSRMYTELAETWGFAN